MSTDPQDMVDLAQGRVSRLRQAEETAHHTHLKNTKAYAKMFETPGTTTTQLNEHFDHLEDTHSNYICAILDRSNADDQLKAAEDILQRARTARAELEANEYAGQEVEGD